MCAKHFAYDLRRTATFTTGNRYNYICGAFIIVSLRDVTLRWVVLIRSDPQTRDAVVDFRLLGEMADEYVNIPCEERRREGGRGGERERERGILPKTENISITREAAPFIAYCVGQATVLVLAAWHYYPPLSSAPSFLPRTAKTRLFQKGAARAP